MPHTPRIAAASAVPPLRFWVGCLLMAAEIALVEKPSTITAGGVSGLAVALAHWLPLDVGPITLAVKFSFLTLAYWHGGRQLALWTGVAILVSGGATWLLELVPLSFQWPPLLACAVVFVFAYSGPVLIVHGGYSGGGFVALAQVLHDRWSVPYGVTIFATNALTLTMIYVAYGSTAGLLSLVATLASGPVAQVWWYVWRRTLGAPAPTAGSAGTAA